MVRVTVIYYLHIDFPRGLSEVLLGVNQNLKWIQWAILGIRDHVPLRADPHTHYSQYSFPGVSFRSPFSHLVANLNQEHFFSPTPHWIYSTSLYSKS